jgi:hypothetical protein
MVNAMPQLSTIHQNGRLTIFLLFLSILTGCVTLGFPGYDYLKSFDITDRSGEVSLHLRHDYHGLDFHTSHELPDSVRYRNVSMAITNTGKNTIGVFLSLHDDKTKAGKAIAIFPGESELIYYGPLRFCSVSFSKLYAVPGISLVATIVIDEPALHPIKVKVGADRGG